MPDPPDVSFDAAIRFAADLIRIPSPSGGEERVAQKVVEEMRRLGYDHAATDELGNAVGIIRGRGLAPPLMLSCHLDVVDAGDPAGWEYPPYDGVVADGFLHGRGAMDIKGPLALQTYAAAAFGRHGDRGTPPGDLIVAHTVFEERGGWGMAHLLEYLDPRPGVVLIGESTSGDICIGHRGRAEVEIEIRGRAGHASAPHRAQNALDGAGAVLDAVRRLPEALAWREDPLLGSATLVATDLAATPASRNVIPDRVVIVLDWRVLPGTEGDDGLRWIREFLVREARLPEGLALSVDYTSERQRSWTGRETTWRMFGPGFLLDPEAPLPRAAARAVAATTGLAPLVRPWGFATDGRHTAGAHGIPTIGYAPGEEGHAHTNRERLELAAAAISYEALPTLIAALFEALAGNPGAEISRPGSSA